jgi:hypothetical protein
MSSETEYDSLPSPPKQSRVGLQRRKGATTRCYGKRGAKPAPPSAAGPSQSNAGKRRLDSSSSDDDGELSTPYPEGRSGPSKQSQPAAARRRKMSAKGKERALEEADADIESEAEGAQTSPVKTVSIGRTNLCVCACARCRDADEARSFSLGDSVTTSSKRPSRLRKPRMISQPSRLGRTDAR